MAADFVGDGAHVWVGGVEQSLRFVDAAGEHDVDVAGRIHVDEVEVHDVVFEVGGDRRGVEFVGGVERAEARPDGAPVVGPVHALRRCPDFAAAGAEEVEGAVVGDGEFGQVVAVGVRVWGEAEAHGVLGGDLLAVDRHHR